MNDEMKKKYISASQLSMFERCGESYRRRYIEHEIIPPGIAQVKGSGVHGGAKHNFRQKKETHEDLPKKDIIEISVAEFERVVSKQGVFLTREEESVGYNKVIGETKDSVVRLTDLFSTEVASEYQPVYVEESHRLVIPDSPYDLLAVMDLADDLDRVTDLKTAGKSKTQKEVDTSEQLSMYALVFKAITKRLPTEVRLETLVDTKTPKRQVLTAIRDQRDLEVLVARVDTMIKALAKGVFVPAPANSWACDERYCGYALTCPFYRTKNQ
jgi:hypothetical protein